ncbi:Actin-binding LIM protein 3 [Bagarius yarrelli]|uniref:Actin-binding LIM protein 3 n=1 Tax=Bagarius yarrelli TaxID=175774 RepID=A0A556V9J6_BAGYA|nr:Actin-binding LIM protein 3 [Bagarius yarrelli]
MMSLICRFTVASSANEFCFTSLIHASTGPYQHPGYAGGHGGHVHETISCFRCGDVCRGEVVRVQNVHFHVKCFTCQVHLSEPDQYLWLNSSRLLDEVDRVACWERKFRLAAYRPVFNRSVKPSGIHPFFPPERSMCGCDLACSGFFQQAGEYICTEDYQRLYGTKCDSCGEFITGEVVSALNRAYHPKCFVCTICRTELCRSLELPAESSQKKKSLKEILSGIVPEKFVPAHIENQLRSYRTLSSFAKLSGVYCGSRPDLARCGTYHRYFADDRLDRYRERHLSPDEFYQVFRMTMADFERLVPWKQNELKKQVRLF